VDGYVTRLAEYLEGRELTRSLVMRDIRGQYKGSVLGWFWSLLNPLTTVLIFSFLGSVLAIDAPVGDPSGLDSFVMHLVTGLVPWTFFAAAVTGATGAIVGQGALITKVYFPRGVVVLAKVASLGFTALIEMAVAIVALLVVGNNVLPWLPVVVALMVIQATFALGIGLMLSVVNVYFRDVQYFLTLALQALFYTTPIVYPITLVSDRGEGLLRLYELNPLVAMVEAYRAALYNLRWPEVADVAYLSAWAVGSLLVGAWVFSRFEGRLAEEL
jgi:lipopolysaccharide transport system permease protein